MPTFLLTSRSKAPQSNPKNTKKTAKGPDYSWWLDGSDSACEDSPTMLINDYKLFISNCMGRRKEVRIIYVEAAYLI